MSSSFYENLSTDELAAELVRLEGEVADIKARGLKLNMARGKPSPEQLDVSLPMLDALTSQSDLADGAIDCRNYGCLEGIPSARAFFGSMLDVAPERVFLGGESSLTLMYDALAHAMLHGVCGGEPFLLQMQRAPLKWICLVPGYDRHFGIAEQFGFELVAVPLGPDGPDMDRIEELVADPQVKGMWCVPKYSNPSGIVYADETVARIARLRPAAADFRVYWDNAYCEHDLYERAELANIFDELDACGNPDLVYEFCSTSKMTFPGAGISAMVASEANLADLKREYKHRMIGHDKLNQLRHVRYFGGSVDALRGHMTCQADILRPRFELVEQRLAAGLGDLGGASWTHPRGGYFVSFDGPDGSAKAIVDLCAQCGVALTAAGSTWPYGTDPHDSNIRVAPSFPTLDELNSALDVFVACVKLVSARLVAEGRAHG